MSFANLLFQTAEAIQNPDISPRERTCAKGEKYCRLCNEVKSRDAFYKRSNGYCTPYCKECTSKKQIEWRKLREDKGKELACQ